MLQDTLSDLLDNPGSEDIAQTTLQGLHNLLIARLLRNTLFQGYDCYDGYDRLLRSSNSGFTSVYQHWINCFKGTLQTESRRATRWHLMQ